MLAPWVMDEMKTVDLKDKRLNDRLREVLSQLAGQPTASIPAACGGFAEMTAAYRLFDNDNVVFDNILQPHSDATRRRIAEQPVVLLAQDTTEIDLTRPERQVEGAGPLDGGSRRGVFLHPLFALTPDGTPLGTLHAVVWVRSDEPLPSKADREARRKHTPIEEKESQRWIDFVRHAREEARRIPETRMICVADSEADIYELLVEAQTEPQEIEWVVRACQNRALQREENQGPEVASSDSPAADWLREQVLREEVLFTQSITVRGRKAKVRCSQGGREQPRESRIAEVEVRAARVTLRPPWRPDRKLPPVSVNGVLVRESNPPAGEPRVEWLLVTNLSIDGIEQVRQVIAYYCGRWMIEVFFRTLKSGCRVEERRFEHVDRLLACLAVYLIVAWRTLYVCRLGRSCPDISCEAIFEPAEWKSVYRVVRRQAPPRTPPKLCEMVRMVAQLGGYVNRKRPDEPGPQTVWLGLQRMHDMALCWQLFGPEAKTENILV
jgi:hypothetical protein